MKTNVDKPQIERPKSIDELRIGGWYELGSRGKFGTGRFDGVKADMTAIFFGIDFEKGVVWETRINGEHLQVQKGRVIDTSGNYLFIASHRSRGRLLGKEDYNQIAPKLASVQWERN
ncbi:MAG: hypothetical protein NT076_02240 [Candidatus Pacearchaeota archaeon]|nr:hypothetical protein [Candidatus Pacearchaeota archaeon]